MPTRIELFHGTDAGRDPSAPVRPQCARGRARALRGGLRPQTTRPRHGLPRLAGRPVSQRRPTTSACSAASAMPRWTTQICCAVCAGPAARAGRISAPRWSWPPNSRRLAPNTCVRSSRDRATASCATPRCAMLLSGLPHVPPQRAVERDLAALRAVCRQPRPDWRRRREVAHERDTSTWTRS